MQCCSTGMLLLFSAAQVGLLVVLPCRMLNTKHSLPMQAILQDKLKKVDKEIK